VGVKATEREWRGHLWMDGERFELAVPKRPRWHGRLGTVKGGAISGHDEVTVMLDGNRSPTRVKVRWLKALELKPRLVIG